MLHFPFVTQRIEYVPALDGLRALCVLSVMWYHWAPQTWQTAFPFENGIYIFFALSGYLITGILGQHAAHITSWKDRRHLLKSFIARRSIRILPAYYIALGIALILQIPSLLESFPGYLLHGTNIVILTDREWPSTISHFWTLSVEFQYYLSWSILFLAVSNRAQVWLMITGILFTAWWEFATLSDSFSHLWLWGSWDLFGVGGLIAWVKLHNRLPSKFASHLICWTALFIYVIAKQPIASGSGSANHVIQGLSFTAFSGGLILICVTESTGFVRPLLEHPAILYLGKISYGLYLYHNFANVISLSLLSVFFENERSQPLLQIGINLIVTIFVARLSFRWIEKPASRLRRHFPYESKRIFTTTSSESSH